MEKNRVEVVIDGQIITLVSDEPEAYMQKVALYIDKKLGEIKTSKLNAPISEHLRTLLISVNIADDYFRALEKQMNLEETQDIYVSELGHMQQENALLAEKLHELQAQLSYVREQYVKEVGDLQTQLSQARVELDDYINTFDGQKEGLKAERQNVVNFSSGTGR